MIDSRIKHVDFADGKLLEAFNELKSGKFEDRILASHITAGMNALKQNPLSGVSVPKKLWPQEYVRKFGIDNLRKYNLPGGWRLIYFLRGTRVEITSIILEWFDHKDYEKRFGYKHS